MLTDDEAVAVVLGLIAADRIGLAAEAPAAAAAEAKIPRVLPAPLADRLAALRSSLGFTMRAAAPDRDAPGVGHAARARAPPPAAHERVTITYRTRPGGRASADLDPYGLVFHSGRWYAVGLDHRSGEIRTFRPTGSPRLAPTGRRFEPPADFDAVGHLNRQWATAATDGRWRC